MCSKTFVNNTVLQKHIKAIHENISPFVCSYPNCDKKFRTGYRLYVHELAHKGIKPFNCTICGKTFAEKGTLKAHLLSHNRKNDYQCELCDYKCKSDSHLREHYKYKHNEFKYYKCEVCKMKFMLKSEWKFHTTEHNKITPSESGSTFINNDNFCIVTEISFGVLVY